MQERQPAVYIMSNKPHGTIYIGVTSNLIKRVYGHKYAGIEGFVKKYGCKNLVYYELADNMISAISREKSLKVVREKRN